MGASVVYTQLAVLEEEKLLEDRPELEQLPPFAASRVGVPYALVVAYASQGIIHFWMPTASWYDELCDRLDGAADTAREAPDPREVQLQQLIDEGLVLELARDPGFYASNGRRARRRGGAVLPQRAAVSTSRGPGCLTWLAGSSTGFERRFASER